MAIVLFAAVALIDIALLSRNYSYDSLCFARMIETDPARTLVRPGHVLYCPLGWVLYEGLRGLGFEGRAIWLLQIVSALCGAAGVSLFFWLTARVLRLGVGPGLLAALGLTFSYGYWWFSTQGMPYAPSLLLVVLITTLVASTRELRVRRTLLLVSVATGLAHAAAISLHVSHAVLLPAVLVGFLMSAPNRSRIGSAVVAYLLTLGAATGLLYLVGASAAGYGLSPLGVVRWASGAGHGYGWHPQLAKVVFGAWGAMRALEFLGYGLPHTLKEVVRGQAAVGSLRIWLGEILRLAVVIAALGGWLAVMLLWRRRMWRDYRAPLAVSFAWIVPYAIIALGWFPDVVHRWVMILPALWLVLAVALACAQGRARPVSLAAAAIGIVFLAATNLTIATWPDSRPGNPASRIARSVAAHTRANDLVVVPGGMGPHGEQDVGMYIVYFGHRDCLPLVEIAGPESAKGERVLRLLGDAVDARFARGGRVFVGGLMDPSGAELDYYDRLALDSLDLTPRDLVAFLSRYAPRRAWSVGKMGFWELR